MSVPPRWLQEHCSRLVANDPHLENLNLNLRRLNLEWMNLLAQALQGNYSLKVLNLVGSITTANAETAICQVLPSTKMAKLYLSYNRISDVGAASLGGALRTTSCLKEVYLDFNNIGPEGAASLVKGLLESNSSLGLEVIQLNCNQIGNGGAAAFGQLLKSSSSLKKLYLGRNHIGTEGAIKLLEGLQVNCNVLELNLDGNTDIYPQVSDQIEYLVQANRAGRYLLRSEQESQVAFWSHLLGRVSDQPSMVFFFLTSKPDLCKTR